MSSPLIFAMIDHRSQAGRVFGILPHDLARHVYVIGKSGSGKSTLLERLMRSEIEAGRGCGLLDPHGDLAERMLLHVPRSRRNDLVRFDATDLAHPPALNPLDRTLARTPTLLVSGVLAIFRKVYADAWGPRTEHVLRHVLFALTETRSPTLMDVLRMLGDERFRTSVVRQVRDPVVRFFWEREFPSYSQAFLGEMLSPVRNKVASALTSPLLRAIVDRPRSSVDARHVMDRGRIFVANLAKGEVGEEASALLGAMLVTTFQHAAYARSDVSIETRRPFTLYIDEFASFATHSFVEIFAEARKYGLALVLAHQHLGQLDEPLRRAVLGNAGTIIVFRVSAEDASVLVPEFEPELTAHGLAHLDRHQLAIRLSIDGTTGRGFTARSLANDVPSSPGS